jgi:glycosyltransferase involved in cell wall biosynthesis
MIRTIASVIRGEGLPSALRRSNERIGDALIDLALRSRGAFESPRDIAILNVAASGVSSRLGGVQTQLAARLHDERALREVALLSPGVLERSGRRQVAADPESGIREAIAITGARTVHFEGMDGVPLAAALRLIESGIRVIISVHDFSLFCARPHLLEEPMKQFCFYSQDFDRCHRCLRQTWDVDSNAQRDRRTLAQQLLSSATALIFPSQFLLDQHRRLFALPDLAGEVIAPGVAANNIQAREGRHGIAFAGSMKRHKGAHLLPELAGLIDAKLHVFGGGDEDLFRAMRRVPNIKIHGYYRRGALPSLLAHHGIGLVVVPSIVPESYGLVLSEAWLAGASVAAFDLGAQAERIRLHGGGWLAPLESGAAGLAQIINDWRSRRSTSVTIAMTTPLDAAVAHVELYRKT